MPCRKKKKFVTRRLSKKRRREIEAAFSFDPYYFDEAAWSGILDMAEQHLRPQKPSRAQVLYRARRWKEERAKRQKVAIDRRAAIRDRKSAARFFAARSGPAVRDQIIVAMQPGQWYGGIDVARLVKLPRRIVGRWVISLTECGLLFVAGNPDEKRGPGGGYRDPQKLYCLTPAGEKERMEVFDSVMAGRRHEKRPALVLQPNAGQVSRDTEGAT